jgi:uncharacterized membrane protein (UPF0182 family)
MRPQPDLPRRPSRRERRASRARGGGANGGPGGGRRSRFAGRGRLIVGLLLLAIFVLLISLRGIAAFYTEYLWFDSLHLRSVWQEVLGTRIALTLAGGLGFFLLCWGNLLIAERLAPVFRPSTGEEDLIERYHQFIGHRAWMVRLGVAVLLALVIGVSLGGSWHEWILFRNRVDFGQKDATFHTDIGFYVFQLPFLTTFTGWLFSSLVVVLVVTILAHVVNGGIRFQTQIDRVTPQVKAHLSVLLGALALVQTGRYWLDRYQLTFSTRGTVDGATYTDVNVELRATYLLMLISLFAVGLFIANIWRRGWVLPTMAVGLWVLVQVLAGGVVPAFVQRFRVQPNESSMEASYIRHNIAATREAYGLSDVDVVPFDWPGPDGKPQTLDGAALAGQVGTLSNVRLWDPATMQASFANRQEIKSFYAINDVDVDRYVVNGQLTPVMIASRDLATSGIQQSSWESTHLRYTHGYGVVIANANDKAASGDPNLLAQSIPVTITGGLGKLTQPGIYFGEDKSGYVIVNTDKEEIDYQDKADKAVYTTYDGADGIRIGSGVGGFVRKAAFALRFGDVEPLVSGSINADSKVLIARDVTDRLKGVAPFLAYDHDPYPVLLDGRVKYVVDAYTTTRNYPNAQRADTGGLDPSSGLYGRSFNYARNSVKAVVDAYDGTVTLYVVDKTDPLIRAYQKAFPDLFTDGAKAPKDLVEHWRYPEDLFTVQTQMWKRYHVSDTDTFYNGNDDWNIPQASGASKSTGSANTRQQVGPDGQPLTDNDRYPSQYQLMQLPGEDEASFVLLRPYGASSLKGSTGGSQNQLRAFIVASSDPETYGQIRTYLLSSSELPSGPRPAADEIVQDPAVAKVVKDQCNEKNVCTFTAPAVVPIGDSLLYSQTLLVSGEQGIPTVKYVMVNYQRPGGSKIAIDTNLRGALIKLFGPDVPTGIESQETNVEPPDGSTTTTTTTTTTTPGEPPTGTLAEQEAALIDRLVAAFDAADAAAAKGDQVGYATKIEEASQIAKQLSDLRDRIDAGGGTTTTTTTKPSSGTTTTTRPPTTTSTTSAGA